MRIPALTILAIGMVSAAAPARAQTYDPHFPVCMHVVQFGHLLRGLHLTTRWTNADVGIRPRGHVQHQSVLRRRTAPPATVRAASYRRALIRRA